MTTQAAADTNTNPNGILNPTEASHALVRGIAGLKLAELQIAEATGYLRQGQRRFRMLIEAHTKLSASIADITMAWGVLGVDFVQREFDRVYTENETSDVNTTHQNFASEYIGAEFNLVGSSLREGEPMYWGEDVEDEDDAPNYQATDEDIGPGELEASTAGGESPSGSFTAGEVPVATDPKDGAA